MRVKELKEDPIILEWLSSINCTKSTEMLYLQSMQSFTEYIGQSPEDILSEAEAEIKAGVLMRRRKIKGYLSGFRRDLQDKNLSDLTVRSRLTGVKSFYKSFDIEIPSIMKENGKARTKEENNDIPTKEDIQQALIVCDPLEKAVMLVGVSSGLSSNEIRNLTVKEFKKGYDPETRVTTLKLRRLKTKIDFITFLSPEASKAVWDYLAFRERKSKVNTPRRARQLLKQQITDDKGYLFILRNVTDAYLEKPDESLRQLNENAFLKLYRSISEKAQQNTDANIYNVIRSHNMRKYFNSALLNAEADSFFVEFMMGHSLGDTKEAYYRSSADQLRKTYIKFVPFLTIQKELDISESPEFLAIRRENEILRAETERHMVDRHDIQELRRLMDDLTGHLPPAPGPDATEREKDWYAFKVGLEESGKRIQNNLKKTLHID